MKTNLSRLLAGALSLYAILGSGCFTADIMHYSKANLEHNDHAALQVEHCYQNPAGQLLVTAHGSTCDGPNSPKIPYQAVWFMVNCPALTKPNLRDGPAIVIYSELGQGLPNLTTLAQQGFVEIPFEEHLMSKVSPSAPPPTLAPAQSKVVIYYSSLSQPPNYPGPVLYDPWFCASNATAPACLPFHIMNHYEQQELQPSMLLRLPISFLFDAVTLPIQLGMFMADGKWPSFPY